MLIKSHAMRNQLKIIVLLGFTALLQSQSPHGPALKISCGDCHTPSGWEVKGGEDALLFGHAQTAFPLTGQHTMVDCRACHQTLVFPEASPDCISCHTDMHRTTVGSDCARCHTPQNWLVDDITGLHYDNGFPLLGVHAVLDCDECHFSESALEFNRIGNDCLNCHLDEFSATTNPNHANAGFSTDCTECHRIDGLDWSSRFINHDFFPLAKGHDIPDCTQCHTGGNFSNTPTDCFACHQPDYASALNPNHLQLNFPTSCTDCHTTDVGWMPAEYAQHDPLFPIYSGQHEGEWAQCADCHNNPSNYAEFACTNCHSRSETDGGHGGVNGYVYENTSCYACHPTGDKSDNFDHDGRFFPIFTGKHRGEWNDCIDCHTSPGNFRIFSCVDCHEHDNPSELADKHDEVADYVYESNACYACHPAGE